MLMFIIILLLCRHSIHFLSISTDILLSAEKELIFLISVYLLSALCNVVFYYCFPFLFPV